MLTVKEAFNVIINETRQLGEEITTLENATGRVLAENITTDIDMPPFDRSMMDGYAVRSVDVHSTPTELKIVGFIPAGEFPQFSIKRGEAAKIMTGAPMPAGADSVREVELTRRSDTTSTVQILEPTQAGQHIVFKGTEMQKGSRVLAKGTFINPSVVGVLATAGKPRIAVFRTPKVSILSTGDELVAPSEKPGMGQIRNSNSYTLHALCQNLGVESQMLGVAKDERDTIKQKIEAGLSSDVLLISGGVSMGDLDFVTDVFNDLKLEVYFEKVAIKPGKPTVFAKHQNGLVFGLPGNPVSSSTVFEVFVRPAIRKMMGFSNFRHKLILAEITESFVNKSQREVYHPAITFYKNGQYFTRPLMTKGSGDITGFSAHNSFLICPRENIKLSKGSQCEVQLCSFYDLI
ncbi:MAG: molybdopterin molybdenumtransferase MoeA [Calditrichaeota bacterium]|nr:MAG: molybdopterin molybdenumtransferase MoeA [Calditrichota bacterium]